MPARGPVPLGMSVCLLAAPSLVGPQCLCCQGSSRLAAVCPRLLELGRGGISLERSGHAPTCPICGASGCAHSGGPVSQPRPAGMQWGDGRLLGSASHQWEHTDEKPQPQACGAVMAREAMAETVLSEKAQGGGGGPKHGGAGGLGRGCRQQGLATQNSRSKGGKVGRPERALLGASWLLRKRITDQH